RAEIDDGHAPDLKEPGSHAGPRLSVPARDSLQRLTPDRGELTSRVELLATSVVVDDERPHDAVRSTARCGPLQPVPANDMPVAHTGLVSEVPPHVQGRTRSVVVDRHCEDGWESTIAVEATAHRRPLQAIPLGDAVSSH